MTCSLQVLPHALTLFKEAGYRLVSLSECLNLPSYLRVDPPAQRDVSFLATVFMSPPLTRFGPGSAGDMGLPTSRIPPAIGSLRDRPLCYSLLVNCPIKYYE